MELQSEAD